MRWKPFSFKKTITKYMLTELIGPFSLGLLIFTFVLLMERVLELIELVINKGVRLSNVLELLVYIMPSFLVLTVPMAVLVATLTAFGRLSTDSEVTAMKASGISLYTLLVPVLLFAFAASCITFFLYANALPWGNHNFRVKLYELARTKASIGLKAQVFNTTFPGLIIYIDQINEKDNSFQDVMISNTRDPRNSQIIFARTGHLITDEQALRVILHLEDGVIHPKEERKEEKIVLADLSLGESIWWIMQRFLWDSFFFSGRASSPYLIELHKRFSIPFACLVFGLIGTPLGIQSRRAGKSGGYAISVVLLLIYYLFITAGESLGDDGQLPVFLAVWTPNILLGGVGVILLVGVARR
jgi:lipopolysaccharide export system permease protein